jgi:SAM-dependent methyltransferase
MSLERKPRTSEANGRLWGARAHDWANIVEGCVRPVYETVLTRLAIGPDKRYLDVGCGSGMAAQMAAERGADVSGIDASRRAGGDASPFRRHGAVQTGRRQLSAERHVPLPDGAPLSA